MQSTIFGGKITEESDIPKESKKHEKNKINDLNGTDWIKFTKSWFVFDAKASDLKEEREITQDCKQHPATYSPSLIEEFVKFFTKEGEMVLDPFLGIGSTLVACDRQKRKGIGIELNPDFAEIAKKRTKLQVITGDSTKLKTMGLPRIDFCITSPPYSNMLNKIDVTQKKRIKENLKTNYSTDNTDLGNISDYNEFLEKIAQIFFDIYDITKDNGYLVVIIQNYRQKGSMVPLAWDLAEKLSEKWVFKGEKLWLQDHKALHPFGYPHDWVSNVHHHYCLIFRKNGKIEE